MRMQLMPPFLFEGERLGRHWVYKRLNFPVARSNSSESSLDCDARARVSSQRIWYKCYTHVDSMKLTLVSHYAFSGLHLLSMNESSMIRGRLCPMPSLRKFCLSPTEQFHCTKFLDI